MRAVIGLAVLLTCSAATPPPPAVALPAWMAGCWEQLHKDRWDEECWTSARGQIMLGSSRMGLGDRVLAWEAMQIELGGANGARMTFWASPNGASRTAFAWQPSGQPGVTFVNVANDYPQRIRYWREGALLKAEISLTDGRKQKVWTFRRST